eukprot:scaffold13751_cov150-Skeletonema_menzelii.AAC.6
MSALSREQHDNNNNTDQRRNLGTISGVYLPSLQSILGVILFLRLTHITSQAGIIYTTLLLLICTASTLLTWSSLSAIVTNGDIQSGGPYYIISRTLGVDIGCSLGLLYYIGNTLSGSLFVLGAVEAVQHSIRAYYARWGYGFSGHIFPHDVQLVSLTIVAAMAASIHVGGGRYVTALSHFFFGITALSILFMLLGSIFFIVGWHTGSLQQYDRSFHENTWSRYEPDPYTGVLPDIYSCLALIYPSVTGLLSGMAKIDQLKNPRKSIPKGMFWAIVTSSAIYLMVTWLFGMSISNRTLKVDKFVTASVAFPHELPVRIGVVMTCFGLVLGTLTTAPALIAAVAADEVLPFLSFLRPRYEGDKTRALWFTSVIIGLATLPGSLDHVSPFVTIFYLLMYSGVNAATCISGYVRPPGFRPTFRYFHWSVSFVGFVWCMALAFFISWLGTFCSVLSFLLMGAYIKKSRKLAATGMKWGTLGSAVRYNIVSSALNSLAKSASAVPTEVTLSMSEEGRQLKNFSSSEDISVLSSNAGGGGVTDITPEEVAHLHSTNADFHAKNWRPQILTIVDVDANGNPTNLKTLSLASQLQQAGKGINMVIAIIDQSSTAKAASVASAVDEICGGTTPLDDDQSEISGLSSLAPLQDRWRNEEESLSAASSGMDHYDTIKLIQRSKALLMLQMKREGMDGFAEVSTTDGKFFEAVWSAVIHTGLGPLSPNSILLSLPSFLTIEGSNNNNNASETNSLAHEQSRIKAENYLRTINGILNLGKAVILFKSSPSYPQNGDIIPDRGTIDIWWIVHDGGLLLLLPFLLSKHAVWFGSGGDGKRKKNRLRRKTVGAKLRLFAVTTSPRENAEKLQKAVTEHLERVRIQADVIVVEDLARTDIAQYMRDEASVDDIPSRDMMASSRDQTLKDKMRISRPSNPVASLRKDGISTSHMTLGEVFSSDCYEDGPSNFTHSGDGIQTATVLNEMVRRESHDANLVVTNLPFIQKDHDSEEYFKFLYTVCEGIDNVMLVRGSGAEVITAYA